MHVSSDDDSARDFRARSIPARVEGLAGRQSQPLRDRNELLHAAADARARLAADPDLVPATWTLYRLDPQHFEFFQADANRRHTRLHYVRQDGAWKSSLLWP